ncbi:Rieske 2Fe-2S domain-containing protein [Hyphococcus sp.]|uniref:Rieske 2Fe-2S domain-containing protein n=1 Tax=Hyphococcus sp. TaxID=2038636 RepID=UPI003CCBDCB2
MISEQENRQLTEIQPGAPAGAVLRNYWQPAALVEELNPERPIAPVTLLGEELTLFRKADGSYGLIGRHCPHRGADLCFGRLESEGLRCPFHGWLFNEEGRCLDQPAEPETSRFREGLSHTAYPCVEASGVIFAYLGEGDPPPMPKFDCFEAPASHTFAFKGWWECNWLQALEVGIDPAHASFLHRFFEDESPEDSYGKQFRSGAAGTNIPMTKILRDFDRPNIDLEETQYGFRLCTTREIDPQTVHYRITNMLFPNAIAIPMSDEMTITQWHVPIDNENCYWYSIFTSFAGPVNRDLMRAQRLKEHTLPDYRPVKNKSNNYGFDAEEQKTQTYTGMGFDINVHDQWAVESLGPIQDRTREHLGKSDIGIKRYRRILKQAMQASAPEDMPCRPDNESASKLTGPVAIDALGAARDPECWKRLDEERRKGKSWAETVQ